MSNPTLVSKILEQDKKNMDNLRIVMIQQKEMLHKKQYYCVSIQKTLSTLYTPLPPIKKVDSKKLIKIKTQNHAKNAISQVMRPLNGGQEIKK